MGNRNKRKKTRERKQELVCDEIRGMIDEGTRLHQIVNYITRTKGIEHDKALSLAMQVQSEIIRDALGE